MNRKIRAVFSFRWWSVGRGGFCLKNTEARDASDVGPELRVWRRAEGAPHFVLDDDVVERHVPSDYVNFIYRLFVMKRYRENVWVRLVPCIPAAGEPSWDKLREAFWDAYGGEAKLFKGNFRPTTLRGYHDSAGQWCGTENLQKHEREQVTLKALWEALPRREIELFALEACPRSFADMVDKMRANFVNLRGVFGEYNVKLMLDLLVLLGCVPQEAISRWPVACPGYQLTLARIFPGLTGGEGSQLKALYWIHRQLTNGRWRFLFPESCAQLCWDHRRRNGSLDDRMECLEKDEHVDE